MNNKTKTIKEHNQSLATASTTAGNLIETAKVFAPGKGKAVSHVWDALFDYIHKNGACDLAELNTASGIIQKLAASFNQMQNAELKNREFLLKEKELNAKHLHQNKTKGLTPETLLEVEQKLKLL